MSHSRGSRLSHGLGRFSQSTVASTVALLISAAFLIAALLTPG